MTPTLHLVLSALLGSVLGGGVLYKIVLSALENHMARTFETRENAKDTGDDVERTEKMCIMLSERVGSVEAKVGLIEERQTQQWERIAEQMKLTARSVELTSERMESLVAATTQRMEAITLSQHDLALQMERMKRSA